MLMHNVKCKGGNGIGVYTEQRGCTSYREAHNPNSGAREDSGKRWHLLWSLVKQVEIIKGIWKDKRCVPREMWYIPGKNVQ